MIDLAAVVHLVLYLLCAAAIFGLLFYLVGYIQAKVGGPAMLYDGIRILLVVLIVLVIIGILLSLMGHQVFYWGRP